VSNVTVLIDRNDLRMVVMAAVGFNDGIPVRTDRTEHARTELTEAIQRIAATVDLTYTPKPYTVAEDEHFKQELD
jgi:hypothetical protein